MSLQQGVGMRLEKIGPRSWEGTQPGRGAYWAGKKEPGEFSLGEHPHLEDGEYWDHEPKPVRSWTEEDLTKSSETTVVSRWR